MAHYHVNADFQAFQREYKVGSKLGDEELSAWLPEDARERTVKKLKETGTITVVQVGDEGSKYPSTFGSARRF